MKAKIEVSQIGGQQRYQLTFPAPPIEGVTFSGGGPKGIVYAGALQTLEETNILKGVKRVSGASAGAMTAMMVAIGMSGNQIEEMLKNTDIKKLIDVDLSPTVGAAVNYVRKGRDSGEKLREFMNNMVNQQMESLLLKVTNKESEGFRVLTLKLANNTPFTFNDLRTIKSILPEDQRYLIKDLYIVATNKTKGELEEYSFENTPDMSIAQAAQVSGAHPVMFKPFINENGDKIADGGILNNMPVQQLEKRSKRIRYNEEQQSVSNLCFILGDEKTHIQNQEVLLGSQSTQESILKKGLKSVMNLPISKAPFGGNFIASAGEDAKTARKLSSRVIPLSSHEITTYTLDVDEPVKEKVINEARKTTGAYLVDHHLAHEIPNEKAGEPSTFIENNDTELLHYTFNDALEMGLMLMDEHLSYIIDHSDQIVLDPDIPERQQDATKAKLEMAREIRTIESLIKACIFNSEITGVNPQDKVLELTDKMSVILNRNPRYMHLIQERLNTDTLGQYMHLANNGEHNKVAIQNNEALCLNYSLLCKRIDGHIALLEKEVINRNVGAFHRTTETDKLFASRLIDNFSDLKTNKPCRFSIRDMRENIKNLSHHNKDFLNGLLNELETAEKFLNPKCSSSTSNYRNVLVEIQKERSIHSTMSNKF
ncbi:patatin-like phospholipase family protein [Legionella longbeachae]|uniref:patatin-like phospholipase family protein n=1 Tax=Legionella longbeachae TaxID=450 RepID=UPI0012460DC5|nr:patatin-like phospholipase family protein [Legionella longbeachae]QEY52918.1 patatin-like phospholipase family protein [Legionella longbeachae]